MRPEHADRLPRLHEEGLVVGEPQERTHDLPQRRVRSGGTSRAAVDDQRLGVLRDLGVEVVEEHAERRLGLPRAGVQRRAAGSTDRREVADEPLDDDVAHESPFLLVGRPFAFPFPSGAPAGAARLSRCRKRNQLHPVARTK